MDSGEGQSWQTSVDGQLLAASAGGSQAAFAEIVRRYHGPVYRLAWRMLNGNAEAQDVAQETFVKLWVNPNQVRKPAALRSWLFRVGANLAVDRLRRKPHLHLDTALDVVSRHDQTDRQLAASRRVDGAIAQLPERQRLAIALVYFEAMTNIAAAVVMDISVDAVESLLSRARRQLRQTLAEDGPELLGDLAAAADMR